MLDIQRDLAFLVPIVTILSGFLNPVIDFDLAAGTPQGGEDDSNGEGTGEGETDVDGTDVDGTDVDGTDVDGTDVDGTDSELQPDPDPCVANPNAEGCEVDPCLEDPTLEECEPPNDCDPSYPEDCIPSPPPDLDCGDTNVPNNVRVVEPDPHRLDGDNNGIGCESSGTGGGNGGSNDGSSLSGNECQGQAHSFRRTVTEIVDGDTIDISTIRVRLALVNTPEIGESGYTEARRFVDSVCSVGTKALADEDDRQREGSFDRLIGVVYCGDSGINNKKSLNELLLEGGYAVIDQDFCNISEFSSSSWAQKYGC
jgi:hypothetical protein